MAVKKVSWRRSNQALSLFFFLLVPSYLFSADFGAGAAAGGGAVSDAVVSDRFEDIDVGDPRDPMSYWTVVEPSARIIPPREVEACKQNMPPLLQGVSAYLASPDSQDSEKQIPSFHRLLLVGPPGGGKSLTAEVLAQEHGFVPRIRNASALRGETRGQTAINIRDLFAGLTLDKRRIMLILNEMHKLVEGHANKHTDHAENAEALWGALDDIEQHYPHIVVVGTANDASQLPPELKSRFRVQYAHVPLVKGQQWISGLQTALSQDDSIAFDGDIAGSASAAAEQSNGKAEDKDAPVVVQPEEIQALAERGLSYRDQALVKDAAKIFAYRDAQRTADGKLVITQEHMMRAYAQLLDKEKVLNFYVQHETDDQRQERLHRETMGQSVVHHMQAIRASLMAQSRQKHPINGGANVGGGAGATGSTVSGGLQGGAGRAPGITKKTATEIDQELFTDEQRRVYRETTGREASDDAGQIYQAGEPDYTRDATLVVGAAAAGAAAMKLCSIV